MVLVQMNSILIYLISHIPGVSKVLHGQKIKNITNFL